MQNAADLGINDLKKAKFEAIRQQGKQAHLENKSKINVRRQAVDDRPLNNAAGREQGAVQQAENFPEPPRSRPPTGPNYQNQLAEEDERRRRISLQSREQRAEARRLNTGNREHRRETIATPSQSRHYVNPPAKTYLNRRPIESRDSMLDLQQKRQDVGNQLSALKKQLLNEKEKVESQMNRQNLVNRNFRMNNLRAFSNRLA